MGLLGPHKGSRKQGAQSCFQELEAGSQFSQPGAPAQGVATGRCPRQREHLKPHPRGKGLSSVPTSQIHRLPWPPAPPGPQKPSHQGHSCQSNLEPLLCIASPHKGQAWGNSPRGSTSPQAGTLLQPRTWSRSWRAGWGALVLLQPIRLSSTCSPSSHTPTPASHLETSVFVAPESGL